MLLYIFYFVYFLRIINHERLLNLQSATTMTDVFLLNRFIILKSTIIVNVFLKGELVNAVSTMDIKCIETNFTSLTT